jgi:hypothetical protein
MPAWLIKRKKDREQQQMEAVAAAAKEAAASLKPLTGALADLGKATKKFGTAAALDPNAVTAQKIRITEEQIVKLPKGTIDTLTDYFSKAYRDGKITKWESRRIDETYEREISWQGKRQHSRQVIEDVRSILQLDHPPLQRAYEMTVSYDTILNRPMTLATFKERLDDLFDGWMKSTGIPHSYTVNIHGTQREVRIGVTTYKSLQEITDDRFRGEVKELIAKALY